MSKDEILSTAALRAAILAHNEILAIKHLNILSNEIREYTESVALVMAQQEEAARRLNTVHSQSNIVLDAVSPQNNNETLATEMWINLFNDMCRRLETDNFEDVEEGRVYIDSKCVMYKGSTLTSFMKESYGVTSAKLHFNTSRFLLNAESMSAARKHFRSRVWVVKFDEDTNKLLNITKSKF